MKMRLFSTASPGQKRIRGRDPPAPGGSDLEIAGNGIALLGIAQGDVRPQIGHRHSKSRAHYSGPRTQKTLLFRVEFIEGAQIHSEGGALTRVLAAHQPAGEIDEDELEVHPDPQVGDDGGADRAGEGHLEGIELVEGIHPPHFGGLGGAVIQIGERSAHPAEALEILGETEVLEIDVVHQTFDQSGVHETGVPALEERHAARVPPGGEGVIGDGVEESTHPLRPRSGRNLEVRGAGIEGGLDGGGADRLAENEEQHQPAG